MTRTRLVCSMAAAIAVWPAVAAAQGAQAGPDPRVRVAPRVVEQQRQVERERARERAQEARREQTETMSRTFQIGRTGEIVVNSMAGDVTVTRARGNEALIEATKVARGRTDEEAKQMLALVKVDFVERGNRVEAQSTFQRQARKG